MRTHGVVPDRRLGGPAYTVTVDPVSGEVTIDLPPLRRLAYIAITSFGLVFIVGLIVAFMIMPAPPMLFNLVFSVLSVLMIVVVASTLLWAVCYEERLVLSRDTLTRVRRCLIEIGRRTYPLDGITNLRRGKPGPAFEVTWSVNERVPHREVRRGLQFECQGTSVQLAKHIEEAANLVMLIHQHRPGIVAPSEVHQIQQERPDA